jgi:hypothetical protein
LGKLLVELKTLGWEHSKGNFKNVFKNLGVVSTPLKCFQKCFWINGVGHGGRSSWWFYKKALVFLCSPLGTINPCNHITLVWDGA